MNMNFISNALMKSGLNSKSYKKLTSIHKEIIKAKKKEEKKNENNNIAVQQEVKGEGQPQPQELAQGVLGTVNNESEVKE